MGSALNTTSRQIGSALGAALATSLTISSMKLVDDWNTKLAEAARTAPETLRNIVAPTRDDLAGYFNAYRLMAAIYLFAGIVMIALYRRPTDEQMAAANEVQFVD